MAVVDQFPSGTTEQFGDFEEWSSCATSSDGCLGDWSDFQDSQTWEGDRPASPVSAQESEDTKPYEALAQVCCPVLWYGHINVGYCRYDRRDLITVHRSSPSLLP